MFYKKCILFQIIINFMFTTQLYAQFSEVNIELDMRRISENDRQLLESLNLDIEQYYLNTQFNPDVIDLDIEINIRLVIESISQGNNQNTVKAQAIFKSANSDQYYYAKGMQFPFLKGKKIIYTTIFDPLSSLLDFYAFMFIGAELDTWEYLGGTSFYNRAIDIADFGKGSDWSYGWNDRWKKSRKMKKNQYLRNMRYNYFMALDEISIEKPNIDLIQEYMKILYEELLLIDEKLGSNKETLQFLSTYHKNIAELFATLNNEDALKFLMNYDHDRKKTYKSYLEN